MCCHSPPAFLLMSSIYIFWRLPLPRLCVLGLHCMTILVHLLFGCLATWPAQLHYASAMHCPCTPVRRSLSQLFILSRRLMPSIARSMTFWVTLSLFALFVVSVIASRPYASIGSMHMPFTFLLRFIGTSGFFRMKHSFRMLPRSC